MAKQYKSERDFLVHLAYQALLLLCKEGGGKIKNELLATLEERGHLDAMPSSLRNAADEGRTKFSDRFGMVTRSVFVRAGYLKRGGWVTGWQLTPEGEKVLQSHDEEQVIDLAKAAAKKNRAQRVAEKRKELQQLQQNAKEDTSEQLSEDDSDADVENRQEKTIADRKDDAMADIEDHIFSLSPQEFEHLCAALLRGMGYYTPHIASGGPDGGIDIVAYTDRLGSGPRIKVQVKRYKDSIPVAQVRNLAGLLNEGETGVLITASTFSGDCKKEVRINNKHIELIDFRRFVQLWTEHYNNLPESDKQRLPLEPIHFLAKK